VLHGSRTILMQTEDGQVEEAFSKSAGLDYPGIGPQHAELRRSGRAEYAPVLDREALDAALELTRLEGIIPALESSFPLAYLRRMKAAADSVVVVILSGRGDKDMAAYLEHIKTGGHDER
jgi:tryptophan synthase beta chain